MAMSKTITVWHEGRAIRVYRPVAKAIGLRRGQNLDLGQLPPILIANSAHGLNLLRLSLAEANIQFREATQAMRGFRFSVTEPDGLG